MFLCKGHEVSQRILVLSPRLCLDHCQDPELEKQIQNGLLSILNYLYSVFDDRREKRKISNSIQYTTEREIYRPKHMYHIPIKN